MYSNVQILLMCISFLHFFFFFFFIFSGARELHHHLASEGRDQRAALEQEPESDRELGEGIEEEDDSQEEFCFDF